MRAAVAALLVAGAPLLVAGPQQVGIQVPVSPRIDMARYDSIFVMNFSTAKSGIEKFSLNEETVKFFRNELKSRSTLKVLDPLDSPSLDGTDETVFKDESFWQHVGTSFPGALIVSGQVQLLSERRSGFQTEEVISPTGVPVKVQRFKEGKFVVLQMDLYYLDGATGKSVYKDSFREELTYDNPDQPALYAYYDLMDRVMPRFLGAVIPQKYQETRYLLE